MLLAGMDGGEADGIETRQARRSPSGAYLKVMCYICIYIYMYIEDARRQPARIRHHQISSDIIGPRMWPALSVSFSQRPS